jgi:hypothetical protein
MLAGLRRRRHQNAKFGMLLCQPRRKRQNRNHLAD